MGVARPIIGAKLFFGVHHPEHTVGGIPVQQEDCRRGPGALGRVGAGDDQQVLQTVAVEIGAGQDFDVVKPPFDPSLDFEVVQYL